ncbi:MAG: tRNA (adenosine(37)-N6)-threonylcarbamoyltransferase complex transferase subunit TsaD [Atopobiaceae bacterium]|nr:tRNA (adenosine(37)-N6)-threonylcarbamoyltransferase complex transferase subunit TsaD [Atopobiaceae bacterium]
MIECPSASPLLVLAMDTSTDMLACAVAKWTMGEDDLTATVEVLASGDHLCRRRTNVELTSTALDCLTRSGYTMDDVDAILVGRGPGSFTGVRIGIATAKGLACGLSKPLHGCSTLDAAAWNAWLHGVRGLLGVVGDAMRGEVYPGIYVLDDEGPMRTFPAETVIQARRCVEEWAARADRDELILTGDGLKKYKDAFVSAGFEQFVSEDAWHPTGEGLLRAAASPEQVSVHDDGDPALVLPIYTRLSDAEENERHRLGLAQPSSAQTTGVYEGLSGIHTQLRPMSVNDIEQVAALEDRAFVGGVHETWSEKLFYEELSSPGRTWWVAHDQGTIVGFAGGMLAGDSLEVMDVAVSPDRRHEGIGTRLIARIAYDGQTLGASEITLEVHDGNEEARKLYEGLGFERVGLRRDYYGAGNDALIMTAALPLTIDAEKVGERPEPRPSVRPWPIVAAPRDAKARESIAAAGPLVLAIETSCDETAMAVINGKGEILSNVVATQIDFHARFGGVVPEIASRKHTEAIVGVFEETLSRAGELLGVDTLMPSDLAAVGVTAGPGLVGALVVGVAFAKGLCAATGLPLVPVHHLEGHLMANLFETPDLEPPFVASLVSGGNTMLVHVRAWGDYHILGQTIDDAVGEAFDKVAKALGLGYPGGPVISRLAAEGNARAIAFPRAMLHSHDYRFSLSGLKTAVITYIEGENRAGRPINVLDLAASFQAAVIDVQVAKASTAVDETGVDDFCVGGGVAANPALREAYQKRFEKKGVRVTVPPMVVCGDNGAMIALVALRNLRAGVTAPLTLDAAPNAKLGEWSSGEAPVVSDVWPKERR